MEFSPEFRADWWLGKVPVRKEHSDWGWGLGESSWEHGSGFWLGGLTAPQHATRRTGSHAAHAEVSALILLRDSQVCCGAVAPLLLGQVHCLWHLGWQDRAGGSFRGDSLPCFVSKDLHVEKLIKRGSSNHSLQGLAFYCHLGLHNSGITTWINIVGFRLHFCTLSSLKCLWKISNIITSAEISGKLHPSPLFL